MGRTLYRELLVRCTVSSDGEGPIAVLTPIDVEEQPDPERALAVASEALPVTPEEVLEEATDQLPDELRLRGLRKFFLGRIDVKIVAPFIFVMVVLGIGASFVVLNLLSSSVAQRFQSQLVDAGKIVNDGIIKVESQQLELLRLMSNTEGVDVALQNGDAPTLQKLLLPLQANSTFSFVDVVDTSGKQVLALRPSDDQYLQALDPDIGNWNVTQQSLANQADNFGNKYTELISTSYGSFVYTGGPVLDQNNQVVGAILVGKPFDELLTQLTKDVLASVTVYRPDGSLFGSSFNPQPGDTPLQLDQSTISQVFSTTPKTVQRPLTIGGTGYMELVGGLVIRDKVAYGLGVALAKSDIDRAASESRIQLTIMFMAVTAVVLAIGLVLAKRISTPIGVLVRACQMVARGEFGERVEVKARDETGVLAHTFNQMIDGLKERDRIRDTFGRYMTQQVSDAILKGDVKLGGETRELTLFMSDIRSFTTLSESMKPEDLVAFLNRYFSAMIDCVMAHDGVVDKFMGDAILVVYGAPVRDPEHPVKAVLTALDMRAKLLEFNQQLIEEGQNPIRIGIGVNTGPAVTGNIGSEVRMEYTVIGD